jgi:hypothetical protein
VSTIRRGIIKKDTHTLGFDVTLPLEVKDFQIQTLSVTIPIKAIKLATFF